MTQMAGMKENYRIRYTMKTKGNEAEVMVYSEIASGKFWGDETTATDFDKALKEAKKNGAKNLTIRINSPGGEVYAAVAMRSMVIENGFESVKVMVEGLCASAATLFATIPGAKVVIAEGSEFMIHNPATIAWGNAQELEKTVEHLHKMEKQFHGMYAAKTGESEEQIKEWMDETTWFTAKEAVEHGFCDELSASEKVAACVTSREMALMKAIYAKVPEQVTEIVSNGTSVAGGPTENTSHKGENKMEKEINSISEEELRTENPALYAQIQKGAVDTERERIAAIDAMTVPGYEDIAEKAKTDGTSALDFNKQLVTAMRQKGSAFMQARQKETEPAEQVAGGAAQSSAGSEQQEITDNAKDIARYAQEFTSDANGMY